MTDSPGDIARARVAADRVRPGARLRACAALGVSLLALACARPAPPSGGPVDDSSPAVMATTPALYATDIPLDAPLRLVFSEPMNRSRVLDEIVVRPRVDWGRNEWSGDTLRIWPRAGWADSTTYTVLLGRDMVDQRDNSLEEPVLVVFATGPSVARGRVGGRLVRLGVSQGRVLMLAFPTATEDTTRMDPDRAVSAGAPDDEGGFLIPGLEVARAYEIGAWFDVDGDREFDQDRDLYARALAPVAPDSLGGPLDVEVVLVFADEPGGITGVVQDSTCAALAALRVSLASAADSARAARDSLAALRSSLEAAADSLFGELLAPEGAARPDTLRLRAESLRRRAATIQVPDSSAIAAMRRLPPEALADSAYCERPVIARFAPAGSDSVPFEERLRTPEGAFRLSDLLPGAYTGVVWRDVLGDGEAGDEEPARRGIAIWVPPGRDGVVDTLRFGRPASE